jgi:hydroxymethylpyrimidine kinase/phosphomethylpyrimidine kinase/thiamine-phosphate diphosphorylase
MWIVQAAKAYVAETLQRSVNLRLGTGRQGPLNHLHSLNQWDSTLQQHFNPESLLLYAVTDSSMNRRWGRSTFEAVQAAIEGGATIVQIRYPFVERHQKCCFVAAENNSIPFIYWHPWVWLNREKEAESAEFLEVCIILASHNSLEDVYQFILLLV